MKYARLTKEQLEEMHQEFSRFLASQGIDADEWERIKTEKPKTAEDEIDVFSDVVWDNVLNKVKYLEHFSSQQIFLFKIDQSEIAMISIKVDNEMIDLANRKGYNWLQNNLMDDQVTIYRSRKEISEGRNKDVFALIKQGANITEGELYTYFEDMIESD